MSKYRCIIKINEVAMKSNKKIVGCYSSFDDMSKIRDNCFDAWNDVLLYSSNLKGNWGVSREVFYKYMVPTAEKDPAKFARWMNRLVKTSGVKIKSRAGFIKALNYLRKLNKNSDNADIKKALFSLFEAGLNEPLYASKALKASKT